MSTRKISWEIKATGANGWQPYHIHVPIVQKSGSLNLLETEGPVQACNEIALTLYKANNTNASQHRLLHIKPEKCGLRCHLFTLLTGDTASSRSKCGWNVNENLELLKIFISVLLSVKRRCVTVNEVRVITTLSLRRQIITQGKYSKQ
jgi:hypothetical protein